MSTLRHEGSGRRMLAAVAFADVVDYSAMMAQDQARTLSASLSVMGAVVRPKAADHGGTVVKSTGDGVLVYFGSVLDAVEWAEDVQRALAAPTPEPPESPITLRISVHLGDVIATGDDIFGDGVNVAARLLEHAAPGGVVLSETVHEMVRGSCGSRAIDMGLRQLKSFDRPVRIFHLAPERPGGTRPRITGGPVPSIAVLPLLNLGDDPRDGYLAEGMVEDIIGSLAGLGDLMVISSGSTVSLGNPAMDPREVGRRLGVRYVLAGSLHRSSRTMRVRLRLCDALDGSTLWTETAEPGPDELFDMQDAVVAKVVAGIAPNVRSRELRRAMRKRPESFSAYDHMLRGVHLFHDLDEGSLVQSLACFEAAMAEDPFFGMPFAWAAYWHMMNVGQGRSTDVEHDIAQAGLLAARAIELDANNATALAIYGHTKSFLLHQREVGQLYLQRALASCPNSPLAQLFMAATLAYVGDGERAVHHARLGLMLSPIDRSVYLTHAVLCLAHYAAGRFTDAVGWGEMAHAGNPAYSANHRLLVGSLVAVGNVDRARLLAAHMMTVEPDFSVARWARNRQPFADPARALAFAEQLSLAGLPD